MNTTEPIRSPHLESTPLLTADVTVYMLRDGEDGTRYWHVVVKHSTRDHPDVQTYTRDYLALWLGESPDGYTAEQAAADLLGIVLTAVEADL